MNASFAKRRLYQLVDGLVNKARERFHARAWKRKKHGLTEPVYRFMTSIRAALRLECSFTRFIEDNETDLERKAAVSMTESPPQWVEPELSGEHRLAIDLLPGASEPSRLWFFVHGLNSHRRGEKALYFARQVTRRGDAFASLDLTGHGDSEGDLLGLCLSRNLGDLDRGLRHAETRFGPFSAVYLIGSSMGGLTAVWYAALHPKAVQAAILIAPAFEMAGRFLLSLGRDRAQRWRREGRIHVETEFAEFDLGYGFVEDEFRYPASGLVKQLKTPTLILHGGADESVPCQLSRKFASRVQAAKLVEIADGDHRLTDYKEDLFEAMWAFVSSPPYLF